MPEIREELFIFFSAVVTGAIVRLSYGCIDCFRQIVKHSNLAMGMEDLFFWMSSSIYMFVQIYYTNNGSIRWYLVLGIVLGALFCSILMKEFGKVTKKIYVRWKSKFF